MSTKQLQAANGGHQELMVEFGAQLGLDPQALGQTLAKTIFPNATATKEQVFALLLVAKRYNLDPILKQIFAFPAKGGGIIPIVGYDGFCGLANAHPQFDGVKTDPIMDENGKQIGCTAKVWRKDRTHPVELTEWVSECSTGSGPWKKSPGRMIRNRAVTQAFRLAFSFSGIHLADEAEQIRDAQFSVKEGASGSKVRDINAQIAAKAKAQEEPPVEAEVVETDEFGQSIPSVVEPLTAVKCDVCSCIYTPVSEEGDCGLCASCEMANDVQRDMDRDMGAS